MNLNVLPWVHCENHESRHPRKLATELRMIPYWKHAQHIQSNSLGIHLVFTWYSHAASHYIHQVTKAASISYASGASLLSAPVKIKSCCHRSRVSCHACALNVLLDCSNLHFGSMGSRNGQAIFSEPLPWWISSMCKRAKWYKQVALQSVRVAHHWEMRQTLLLMPCVQHLQQSYNEAPALQGTMDNHVLAWGSSL